MLQVSLSVILLYSLADKLLSQISRVCLLFFSFEFHFPFYSTASLVKLHH
jgi:hypothetical protein